MRQWLLRVVRLGVAERSGDSWEGGAHIRFFETNFIATHNAVTWIQHHLTIIP